METKVVNQTAKLHQLIEWAKENKRFNAYVFLRREHFNELDFIKSTHWPLDFIIADWEVEFNRESLRWEGVVKTQYCSYDEPDDSAYLPGIVLPKELRNKRFKLTLVEIFEGLDDSKN
jgi:hypothetical protein